MRLQPFVANRQAPNAALLIGNEELLKQEGALGRDDLAFNYLGINNLDFFTRADSAPPPFLLRAFQYPVPRKD